MSAPERFVVRVDRSDGSRTYKGVWNRAHCEREAAAWVDSFPDYTVAVVPIADAAKDFAAWSRATRADGAPPYFPKTLVRCADGHERLEREPGLACWNCGRPTEVVAS